MDSYIWVIFSVYRSTRSMHVCMCIYIHTHTRRLKHNEEHARQISDLEARFEEVHACMYV